MNILSVAEVDFGLHVWEERDFVVFDEFRAPELAFSAIRETDANALDSTFHLRRGWSKPQDIERGIGFNALFPVKDFLAFFAHRLPGFGFVFASEFFIAAGAKAWDRVLVVVVVEVGHPAAVSAIGAVFGYGALIEQLSLFPAEFFDHGD